MKSKEECVGEISSVLVVRDVEPTRSDAAIRSIHFFLQKLDVAIKSAEGAI